MTEAVPLEVCYLLCQRCATRYHDVEPTTDPNIGPTDDRRWTNVGLPEVCYLMGQRWAHIEACKRCATRYHDVGSTTDAIVGPLEGCYLMDRRWVDLTACHR